MSNYMLVGAFKGAGSQRSSMVVRIVFSVGTDMDFSGTDFSDWKKLMSSQIRQLPPLMRLQKVNADRLRELAEQLANAGKEWGIGLTNDGAVPAIQINLPDPERGNAGFWLGIHAEGEGERNWRIETKKYDSADLNRRNRREGFFAVTQPSRDERPQQAVLAAYAL